jgi:hypothetical protein
VKQLLRSSGGVTSRVKSSTLHREFARENHRQADAAKLTCSMARRPPSLPVLILCPCSVAHARQPTRRSRRAALWGREGT